MVPPLDIGVAWLLAVNDEGIPVYSKHMGIEPPSVTKMGILSALFQAAFGSFLTHFPNIYEPRPSGKLLFVLQIRVQRSSC
jgi:hypothetical protein